MRITSSPSSPKRLPPRRPEVNHFPMAKLQIFFPNGTEATHDLMEGKTSVGRISENQLHIPDDSVSSLHAEIVYENANFYVRDLDSTNGTRVNDEKITEAQLQDRDRVQFGQIPFRYEGNVA
ncbi:MAG: FHA domain-containing protein, partial [Proteobacteria bacterium]|nr:FHA domain-containing protein [Pseudomonadota bacterium]